ncbi:MAG TPA: hypothetical protein VM598_14565 [Bdellovibrionota bacterium]|nr:hypothetical protein [Bdellovibrionota bacterium]
MNPKVKAIAGLAAAGLLLVGCNIFNPFDSPTSEAQLLSVARACFDNGDFECARENYGKLSGSFADVRNSEEAFLAVEQVGAGMGAFIAAFGADDVDAGRAITSIANSVGANATRANRVALFAAYQKAAAVSDTRLKGLTRFVTSMALIANMLSENAVSKGNLLKTDLAANPTACTALGAGCVAAPSCGSSGNGVLLSTGATVGGDGSLDGVTAADVDNANASIEIFNAAITTINDSLSQMGATTTSADLGAFAGTFAALAIGGTPDSPCYRQALIDNEVGR